MANTCGFNLDPRRKKAMRRLTAILIMLLVLSGVGWAQWNEDGQQCFELTKPESYQPDKALPYCNRAIASGELIDRNLATIYYYRASIYAYKKDYKRAIPDFDQATRLDPSMAQAYNGRGFARFFLGQFEEATKDFGQSINWRPTDKFAVLWRYITQSRSGADARSDLEFIVRALQQRDVEMDEWPAPVISFYRGHLSIQDLLKAAADSNPKKQREKRCEAYFYIGQLLLTQGKKNEAIKMLRAAVAANVTDFIEHEAAKAELKRLGS
jgi:lipoprotein NlpI